MTAAARTGAFLAAVLAWLPLCASASDQDDAQRLARRIASMGDAGVTSVVVTPRRSRFRERSRSLRRGCSAA